VGLNPAGGAGVRSPAQARADRRAARRRCSPGIDALWALHGAANGACARTPAPPAWTVGWIGRHGTGAYGLGSTFLPLPLPLPLPPHPWSSPTRSG